MNPNADKIIGTACGNRVEDVEAPVASSIRQLDRLVDELARESLYLCMNNISIAIYLER